MLPGLERVVIQYQTESQSRVMRLQRTFTIGLFTLSGLLIFSWFGVFRPMARRLREELIAHQAAEERNDLILESMSEGIFGLDQAGCATFINRAAVESLGFAPDELLGRLLHPVVHHSRAGGSPYPREECPAAMTLADGKGRVIEGEIFWRKDGSSFPVHYSSTPINKDGQLIGAVVTFRDISAEIATKRALEASEQVKGSILDAALDAIVTIDRHGRVVEFNPAAERIFGRNSADVVGLDVAEIIIPPAHREAHRRGLARVVAGQASAMLGKRMEMTGQHADGRQMPMELTITHLPDHGLFTAFIRNLTEQKETEAALRRSQKMEAVGQLTGGIAHDFNNLLGIITGNLELLEKSVAENEVGSRRLAAALKSARRGADLTRRLLSFSRQDRDGHCRTRTDLKDAVMGMQEMLQRSLTRRIEVRTRLAADTWEVQINRGEFEDCLLNLVINARDAMPNGGTVLIETDNVDVESAFMRVDPNLTAGEYAVVTVSDTGSGIDKAVIEHIFEPFFTTKERGKGTGLGLAMAYGFAKRSGGHIRVYSEPGRGTSFRLYLPRSATPREAAAEIDEVRPLPTGSETILVLDDEAHLAEIACEFLSDLGYTAIPCLDAETAWTILNARTDIALLFTDVVMPHGLDGFGLERRVIEAGLDCKVLLTSGFAGFGHAAEDKTNVLPKPYGKAALARRVRQCLDGETAP